MIFSGELCTQENKSKLSQNVFQVQLSIEHL